MSIVISSGKKNSSARKGIHKSNLISDLFSGIFRIFLCSFLKVPTAFNVADRSDNDLLALYSRTHENAQSELKIMKMSHVFSQTAEKICPLFDLRSDPQ